MGAAIRLVVVDDNADVVAAWRRLVAIQPDMELVATLSTADDLVATCCRTNADAVLLDLRMAGRDPLEALAELTARSPRIGAVVCSGLNDRETTRKALRAGAIAHVSKLDDPAQIVNMLRGAARQAVERGQAAAGAPPQDASGRV